MVHSPPRTGGARLARAGGRLSDLVEEPGVRENIVHIGVLDLDILR